MSSEIREFAEIEPAELKVDSADVAQRRLVNFCRSLTGKGSARTFLKSQQLTSEARALGYFQYRAMPFNVGTVTTNPAQILRDDLKNAAPLALSGIVPCKVTNENGAILPGDLLVSSTMPGYAMKAGKNPPAGTVIGKALERLKEGEERGVIEVAVMLR